MNPVTPPPAAPRRKVGRWVLGGLVLLLAPVVALGICVYSMLTLSADAAVLRRELTSVTRADWHTKVQLDAGWATLGAVRTVLRFVHHEHMEEARLALAAVRRASVGVYECKNREAGQGRELLFARADELMHRRGLTRLVGVVQDKETVLVYTSEKPSWGNQIDLCVAVLEARQMVVVATTIDADALAKLVGSQTGKKFGNLKALAFN